MTRPRQRLLPLLSLAVLLPAAVARAEAPATDLLGDPLPPGAVARWGTVRLRQGRAIGALAFAPDGKTVASGGYDRDVYLWQADSGRERRRFTGHAGPVRALAFSADGKKLASGGDDKTVRVWDVDTGGELLRLEGHTLGVLALAFAPDGKRLASAGSDYVVRLWDLETGKEGHKLQGHDSGINAVAFSPDGKTLASGGDDDTIRLWDATSGRFLRKLTGHDDLVLTLAFAPNGKWLVSGSKDETVRLWHVGMGLEQRKVKAHADGVLAVAFSADGKGLTSAGKDGKVARWDAATGKELGRCDTPQADLTAAALSPDGTRVATGRDNGLIGLRDAVTGKELVPHPHANGPVKAVAFSPDGKALALADPTGSVLLLDPASAKELRRFKAYPATALTFSPDGKVLAINGLRDGERLSLWDVAAGKPLRDLPGEEKGVFDAWLWQAGAFTADGKLVVGPTSRWTLRVWEAATGKVVRTFSLEVDGFPPRGFALAPDGRTLGVGYPDRKIRLWDVATGQVLRAWEVSQEGEAHHLTFSPDGRLLAAEQGSAVRLWEVLTGQEVATFARAEGTIRALAFSPDGRVLVAGGADRAVYAWSLPLGRQAADLIGHQEDVTSLAFAPDGGRLASASQDGTALVWDTAAFRRRGPGVDVLAPKELEALWNDLTGNDAAKAHRAQWALAAAPKAAVPFLGRHLRPVPRLDPKRLARLLADLDSDEFDVRDKATKELKEAAESVEFALRQEQKRTTSEEVRQRLGQVLEGLDGSSGAPERRVLPSRALLVLEQAGTPESRQALAKLAEGAPAAWLTREAKAALARLDRRPAPAP